MSLLSQEQVNQLLSNDEISQCCMCQDLAQIALMCERYPIAGSEFKYMELSEQGEEVEKKEWRYSWGHNFCIQCIKNYIGNFNNRVKQKLGVNQDIPLLTGPMDRKGPSIYKCPMIGCYNVINFEQISILYSTEIQEEIKSYDDRNSQKQSEPPQPTKFCMMCLKDYEDGSNESGDTGIRYQKKTCVAQGHYICNRDCFTQYKLQMMNLGYTEESMTCPFLRCGNVIKDTDKKKRIFLQKLQENQKSSKRGQDSQQQSLPLTDSEGKCSNCQRNRKIQFLLKPGQYFCGEAKSCNKPGKDTCLACYVEQIAFQNINESTNVAFCTHCKMNIARHDLEKLMEIVEEYNLEFQQQTCGLDGCDDKKYLIFVECPSRHIISLKHYQRGSKENWLDANGKIIPSMNLFLKCLICEKEQAEPYFFIKSEVSTIYKMLDMPVPGKQQSKNFESLSLPRQMEEKTCILCKGMHVIKTENLKQLLYYCESWGEYYCKLCDDDGHKDDCIVEKRQLYHESQRQKGLVQCPHCLIYSLRDYNTDPDVKQYIQDEETAKAHQNDSFFMTCLYCKEYSEIDSRYCIFCQRPAQRIETHGLGFHDYSCLKYKGLPCFQTKFCQKRIIEPHGKIKNCNNYYNEYMQLKGDITEEAVAGLFCKKEKVPEINWKENRKKKDLKLPEAS